MMQLVGKYVFSSVKEGALSSLWTATSPEVTAADGGKYAMPYARWAETSHPKAESADIAKTLWARCELEERKVVGA